MEPVKHQPELEAVDGDGEQMPNTYPLLHPVDFGEERIEVLELRPNGRAMAGVKLQLTGESIDFEPYKFAELGVKLAGKPRSLVDKMHPRDITGLGMIALGFIVPGQGTGSRRSP